MLVGWVLVIVRGHVSSPLVMLELFNRKGGKWVDDIGLYAKCCGCMLVRSSRFSWPQSLLLCFFGLVGNLVQLNSARLDYLPVQVACVMSGL